MAIINEGILGENDNGVVAQAVGGFRQRRYHVCQAACLGERGAFGGDMDDVQRFHNGGLYQGSLELSGDTCKTLSHPAYLPWRINI